MENIILSKSGTQVTIHTFNDEENFEKETEKITPPQSSGNWASGPKDTKIVDLLRIEKRITFDGYLAAGTVSGDSSSTVAGKKTDLKTIHESGGVVNMTYEGSTFTVNFEKMNIRRVIGDGDHTVLKDGEVGFEVKMTVIRGVNL
jgi:hypothetical protein